MNENDCGENSCGGCGGDHQPTEEESNKNLSLRMKKVKNKILILSGKGGVGKSSISVNLAVALSKTGKKVGLLDIDIHGPSIPKLLHLEKSSLNADGAAILPIEYSENLKVMSIGFALPEEEEAIIWRGPMKHGIIKQFLADVNWGALDYLIVDSPPGTGDEPLSIAQFMEGDASAIIVTTPQDLAISDVKKGMAFCRKLSIPIIGVIENMSGFICPKCGERIDVFKSGGGMILATEMDVPFLGKIPVDPDMVLCCDEGDPLVDKNNNSETAKAFNKVVKLLD